MNRKSITLPPDQWDTIIEALHLHRDQGPEANGWQSEKLENAYTSLKSAAELSPVSSASPGLAASHLTSPAFLALLASIKDEWTCVEIWASLAPSFEGMPEGEDFAQLVRDLEAVEAITTGLHNEQDLP